MEDDIAVARLLQRTLKGFNQMMGKLADKSHGVCKQYLLAILQGIASGGGVQGGEKLILRQDSRPGQTVEQGGLSRIGIAHNRRGKSKILLSLLPGHLPVALHISQFLFKLADSLVDKPAVCFQLFLTWASGSYAASQTGQGIAHSHQTHGPVF